MSSAQPYDVFIVGGGINGCGIARDAAGRGFSVCLAEMNDLASGTSSASTKLIHGGLRYLEYYEFRLVREALKEREVLWSMAPHIIWPLRFVLPYHKGLRPAWLLRLGLFLYDHLGGRKRLPPTRAVDMRRDPVAAPLKKLYRTAFEYSDCWVNDARLVVLNAMDAARRGAVIRPRTKVVSAQRGEDGLWHIGLEGASGERQQVKARLLVNAAGPWIDRFLAGPAGRTDSHNIRLVQGSHIVVRKLFEHDRSYIFQNGDGRIVFAIPFEREFTLIGTTDYDTEQDPADIRITPGEIDYLCAAASEYFERPITPDDVVWTYAGVRPLYDDGAAKAQAATRDYVLKQDGDAAAGEPVLINILGGKITTYRRLAESVMAKIEDQLGARYPAWTEGAVLPGGDFPATGFDWLVGNIAERYPFLGDELSWRLARHYGTRAIDLLGRADSLEALGQHFGGGLYEAEVLYLIEHEWAFSAQDIVWRRSKLGLRLSPQQIEDLERFVAGARGDRLRQSA